MFPNLHLAFSPPLHTWLFLLTESSPLSRQEDWGLQTWWKSSSPHCKSHFPSLPFTLSLLNLDLEFQSTVEISILVCNLKSFKYKINFGRLLGERTPRPLNTWKRTWLSECPDEMREKSQNENFNHGRCLPAGKSEFLIAHVGRRTLCGAHWKELGKDWQGPAAASRHKQLVREETEEEVSVCYH